MRKRKKRRKKKKGDRDPHVAQRAANKSILALARNPHPRPNLNLNILDRPDER
jgi:hypothetical protein